MAHYVTYKSTIKKLRTELWTCHLLSERRCLRKACEWAEDLIFALPDNAEDKQLAQLEKDLISETCLYDPKIEHARMCFELQEYERAAHILKDHQQHDEARFLHYFSRYKSAEKKRMDLMGEPSTNIPKKAMSKFMELRDSLERSMRDRQSDGWLLYVYALVLYKFKLHKVAIQVLESAINSQPNNWSAWYMLSVLIDSKEQLNMLTLPTHLFRLFFYYMMRLDLDMNNDDPWKYSSADETKAFTEKYFKNSSFIQTLNARSFGYQNSEIHRATQTFAAIRSKDPYRVEGMEIYSNLLYVRRLRRDLSKLAYEIEKVDPFTSEANACIANSYSVRDQHSKAIIYFTRALKINPESSNSWTLLGHEHLEMKCIDKALQCYRHAIAINRRDCRAWLGLGNTIETMNTTPSGTPSNFAPCLYYFSQVARYRPKDQLMYMALGCIYAKLDDLDLAVVCLKRSGPDGIQKLHRLFEDKNVSLDSILENLIETYGYGWK